MRRCRCTPGRLQHNWDNAIEPYLKNSGVLRCPSATGTGTRYGVQLPPHLNNKQGGFTSPQITRSSEVGHAVRDAV